MLPAEEGGHGRGIETEQDGPEAQNILSVLREEIGENRGPDGSQGMLPGVRRELGPGLGGWQTWQDDLRKAMRQYPPSNRVEREGMAALPPLGGGMAEREANVRNEESPGYGRDPTPRSLPLVRVEQDVDLEDRETPFPMDIVEWGSSEGGDELRVEPSATGRQQEGYPSSNPEPRAGNRRATGSGTPAAHRREELALLGATRRQAVRFLGRCRAGPPHW